MDDKIVKPKMIQTDRSAFFLGRESKRKNQTSQYETGTDENHEKFTLLYTSIPEIDPLWHFAANHSQQERSATATANLPQPSQRIGKLVTIFGNKQISFSSLLLYTVNYFRAANMDHFWIRNLKKQ